MTLKRRIAKLEEAGQYITMPNPRYMTDEQLEDWCNYFQWADPEAWAAPPTLTEAEVERELKRTTWPTKYYPPPWPGGKREP